MGIPANALITKVGDNINADLGEGGLIAMTVDMAYSHGRQGIRVNAVAPGHITTPMVLSVSAASASGPAPGS